MTGLKVTQFSNRYGGDLGGAGVVANGGTTGSGGGDITGSLGGDLTVSSIQGIPVDVSTPSDGQVLTYVAADSAIELVTPGSGPGPSSPISGATVSGNTGGSLVFDDGGASAGGDAAVLGGAGDTGNPGGNVFAQAGDGGTGADGGAAILSGGGSASGGSAAYVQSNGVTGGLDGKVQIQSDGSVGAAAQFFASDGGGQGVWTSPIIRVAAGVPSGALTAGELPIAVDTTALTGGIYVTTNSGASWVKASSI